MIVQFLRRCALLVRRGGALDDLEEEMRLHVALRAEKNRQQGMRQDEAARAARRRFGNVLKLREESRDAWGFARLEHVAKDLRYALRQLARRPAWTAMIVMTLALGIGANTSIFTLVNATLFKLAPGTDPGRLVWLAAVHAPSGRIRNLSYPDYVALRERSTTLSGVLAYAGTEFAVSGQPPERVSGEVVSGNYFEVLGLRQALGRTFAPDDDQRPGARPVAVLSDTLWKRRFNADSRIVGTIVTINGRPFTIIGVAPRGFAGIELEANTELWVPLAMQKEAMPASPNLLAEEGAKWLRVAGRLRRSVSAAQADAETQTIARQLISPPTERDRRTVRVMAMKGVVDPASRGELAPIVGLLAIVPALVLLVACANVANVLIARNLGRRKELAMRRAIGATRWQIVRQLLTESALLALLAAIVGFAVSFGLTAVIEYFGEVPAAVRAALTPDLRVLAATTTLAGLTTIVFGLAPALTATKFDLLSALNDEGAAATAGVGRTRLRRALVAAQVAVSVVLLITAGLFVGSLSKALRVDPGFEVRQAATMSFDLQLQGYSRQRIDLLVRRLLERAAALPGVRSAAVTSILPLSGRMAGTDVIGEDRKSRTSSTFSSVSPGYFRTMRIGLLRGRDFSDTDSAASAPVVIINETLAYRLSPASNPIGRRLRLDESGEPWREIVGVARDGKYDSLTEERRAALYLPLPQAPASPLSLVVRTAGDPGPQLRQIESVGRELDRNLPLFRVETLEQTVRLNVDKYRAAAALLGVFGVLTLLLASIGIYGVAAHSVSLRTREVGIRMSLGAQARDVLRMFVSDGLRIALAGVAIGLVVSAAVLKLLTSFLFGLTPTDAVTFAAGAGVLCVVAIVASYAPARRAVRTDPSAALRHE